MKLLHVLLSVMTIVFLWSCAAKKEFVETQPEPKIPDVEGTYFWAVKPEVNVRSLSSINSDKLGKLNDGDSVLVIKNTDGWYRVFWPEHEYGYIRSDLLGPKSVSVFAKAVDFVNELKENENIDLFFDKNIYHRRIYIVFPPEIYISRSLVEQKTNSLVEKYQKRVYRGDVTARILQPDSQEEYLTLDFKGQINPDIKLPVIPFGILNNVYNDDPAAITLTIQIADSVEQDQILLAARNMVSVYPLSYNRVSLKFVSSTNECRLWFTEDESGEDYKLDECPE